MMEKDFEFDEIKIEKELANIICIFYDKNKPGIKFFDRSPNVMVSDFAGHLPEGKFITDRASISRVQWNDEINIPNKPQRVLYKDGSLTVKTYMVTESQMRIIGEGIFNAIDRERIIITIPSAMQNDYDQNYIELENFVRNHNEKKGLK